MKRLVGLLVLALLPFSAFAFDLAPAEKRVAILRAAESDRASMLSDMIGRSLRDRLRKAGIDAFTLASTPEEVAEGGEIDADYYVVVAARSATDTHGAVTAGGRH